MSPFYRWDPQYADVFIAILSVTVGFSVYWFLGISESMRRRFFENEEKEVKWISYVFFQKVTGAVFMGIIPGIVILSTTDYSLADLGIKLGNYQESLIYIGIMGALIILINYLNAGNKKMAEMYPQMRLKVWGRSAVTANTVGWILYLFHYEFMYRGILLMVCYNTFGFWPAVAINLSFYSATHIAKGLGETIGTFPYGLLLCFVTISTDSIAVAFTTHLIMALSNDYFSILRHPEMKFS